MKNNVGLRNSPFIYFLWSFDTVSLTQSSSSTTPSPAHEFTHMYRTYTEYKETFESREVTTPVAVLEIKDVRQTKV